MSRSDYEVVGIVIRDLDKGNMSVTNDAEDVVAELAMKAEGRVFYFDSQGVLSELVHDHGIFEGFDPVSVKYARKMTQDEAEQAVSGLIVCTDDARSNYAAFDGVGTVTIDGRELTATELRGLANIIDAVED